jgi:RNA polymerase sigma-70 factor, ECF subfamily
MANKHRLGTTAEREASDAGAEPCAPAALASLLSAIAARSPRAEDAMRELHDRTVGTLMALAQSMLRNRSDAEEIVCDTFVQVWQTAGRFDLTRAAPMGWLTMICRSRALDRIREHKLRAKLTASVSAEPTDTVDEGPERLLAMLQVGSTVHAALAGLATDKRRLIELAFIDGMSHAALSERMQVPLGTVKSTLRRSLQSLHQSLQGAT